MSFAIGAEGGAVCVVGGSVRIGNVEREGGTVKEEKYEADINGAYSNTSAYGAYLVDTTRTDNPTVSMVTIDLGAEVNPDGDPDKGSNAIIDWNLQVAGVDWKYGAPAQMTDGKLYLWLPKKATDNVVAVTLSYWDDEKNAAQPVNPLFRNPGQEGTTLKRYIEFELPAGFDNLTKEYDGTPFDAIDPKDIPETDEEIPKTFTDPLKMQYKYQLIDPVTGKLGPEVSTGTSMPVDVGQMKLTIISTEYADEDKAGFKNSYWGHRAFGTCTITPVPSRIASVEAAWEQDLSVKDPQQSSLELTVTVDVTTAQARRTAPAVGSAATRWLRARSATGTRSVTQAGTSYSCG